METQTHFLCRIRIFEKQRIKGRKPKSKLREEMESVHGLSSVDIEHNSNGSFLVMRGEKILLDRYDKFHFVRTG